MRSTRDATSPPVTTYSTLDAEIIRSIQVGKHPLYAKPVCTEARRIAAASGRDEMRVIDGRLQTLRKAGKIAADRKAVAGWVIPANASTDDRKDVESVQG